MIKRNRKRVDHEKVIQNSANSIAISCIKWISCTQWRNYFERGFYRQVNFQYGKTACQNQYGIYLQCERRIFLQREMWVYRIDDYNFRFLIVNGQIINDHWSRF